MAQVLPAIADYWGMITIAAIAVGLLLAGLGSRALHDPRDDLLSAQHLPAPHSAWFSRY